MQQDEDEEDLDARHYDPDSDMEMDYRAQPLEGSARYFSSSDSWCLFLCHYSVSSDCSALCQFCVIGEVFKVQELRENLLELRSKIRYLITSVYTDERLGLLHHPPLNSQMYPFLTTQSLKEYQRI